MGLETMRGGYGRCPPLLVGGLLVVCLILTCNWWSLSTQNYELVKQIDEIGEQLRRCADERDQSIQLRLSVEGRLKSTEEDLAQLRVRLEQQEISADDTKKQLEEKDADIKKVNKELESSKNSVTMCTTELESLKKLGLSKDEMIASLKVEKDGVLAQREERKKEIEKLKVELSKSTYHQGPSVIVMKAELNAAKVSQPAAPIASGNQVPPGKPTDTKAKVAAKPADLNADEKDEDNAKERGDEANAVDAVDAEDERFDKNNDDNDGNNIPEENAQEDSVDQMAHAIQEDINEGGVAQPPPVKSANT